MKTINRSFILLFAFLFAFTPSGIGQEDSAKGLQYEVHKIYPFISATKAQLVAAQTISDFRNKANDLNLYYKSSWVREYRSVEIMVTHQGLSQKAVSHNDILTQEQKDLMLRADVGTDISVNVHYWPENTLAHNDLKELSFTFVVEPDREATYPGGEQQLKQYLKEKIGDQLPNDSFQGYDLTAVQFSINEAGEVTDAHLVGTEFQEAKNEAIDQLLLETVRNMPCWQPAAYANGLKVQQNFVLTVGNLENCLVGLLNIRRK